MVTPPPSISTRRGRARRARRRSPRGLIQPSSAGRRTDLDPGGPRAVAGLDHDAPGAVGGERPGVVGQAAARVDHHARRARPVDQPHGQPRVVGERGAHPDDHGVGERAAAVQVAQAVRPGDRRGVAGERWRCGRRATGRPGRRGRARRRRRRRAARRARRRPRSAADQLPARPRRPPGREGEQRRPDLVRDFRALHRTRRSPQPRSERGVTRDISAATAPVKAGAHRRLPAWAGGARRRRGSGRGRPASARTGASAPGRRPGVQPSASSRASSLGRADQVHRHVAAVGVAGDEGRRLVVAEHDEERPGRRRGARRRPATDAQRVVERAAGTASRTRSGSRQTTSGGSPAVGEAVEDPAVAERVPGQQRRDRRPGRVRGDQRDLGEDRRRGRPGRAGGARRRRG